MDRMSCRRGLAFLFVAGLLLVHPSAYASYTQREAGEPRLFCTASSSDPDPASEALGDGNSARFSVCS